MSNSELISYTQLSPNHSGERKMKIDRISPHCFVGQFTIENMGYWFSKSSTKASANYGIDKAGKVGLFVEEDKRSWCSSSNSNDQRAVTIECACDTVHPYKMNSIVYETLILLCTDICKRNGKNRLLWIPDKNTALKYTPKDNEMLITIHRWFARKECPGDWLIEKLPNLVQYVNSSLNPTKVYRVQVGAFLSYANAKSLLDRLKESGFYGYITE